MGTPEEEAPHWMIARAGSLGPERRRLDGWTRWGFVLFATCALVYGLGGLYVSGERVQSADLLAAEGSDTPATAELSLDPTMNPLRLVLHAARSPLGSDRWHFEVQLADAHGRVVLTKQDFLGSTHDEASVVMSRTDLGLFEVAQAGPYRVQLRPFGSSMDDLRELRLEVRRNVMRLDARLLWGLGLAAFACLIANLASSSRRRPLVTDGRERPRRAA